MVGAQPAEGSQIPGIRKWPEAYLPKIFDRSRVDAYESIVQADAETMARRLAAEEGIFAGISSAGALVASRVAERVNDATIVFIVCDRGDRYLSTGVFNCSPRSAARFPSRGAATDRRVRLAPEALCASLSSAATDRQSRLRAAWIETAFDWGRLFWLRRFAGRVQRPTRASISAARSATAVA